MSSIWNDATTPLSEELHNHGKVTSEAPGGLVLVADSSVPWSCTRISWWSAGDDAKTCQIAGESRVETAEEKTSVLHGWTLPIFTGGAHCLKAQPALNSTVGHQHCKPRSAFAIDQLWWSIYSGFLKLGTQKDWWFIRKNDFYEKLSDDNWGYPYDLPYGVYRFLPPWHRAEMLVTGQSKSVWGSS